MNDSEYFDALQSLDARINALLDDSSVADPVVLAESIQLRAAERRALVWYGLVDRIGTSIRQRRRLLEDRPVSYRTLGAERTQIVDRRTPERIAQAAEEARAARDAIDRRFYEKFQRINEEFANAMRAEGIKIGLEQARSQRVSIGGEWKMLAECSPRDLRELASEYQQRVVGNAERGAFFAALADQVEFGGFATVEAMCEAQFVLAGE